MSMLGALEVAAAFAVRQQYFALPMAKRECCMRVVEHLGKIERKIKPFPNDEVNNIEVDIFPGRMPACSGSPPCPFRFVQYSLDTHVFPASLRATPKFIYLIPRKILQLMCMYECYSKCRRRSCVGKLRRHVYRIWSRHHQRSTNRRRFHTRRCRPGRRASERKCASRILFMGRGWEECSKVSITWCTPSGRAVIVLDGG